MQQASSIVAIGASATAEAPEVRSERRLTPPHAGGALRKRTAVTCHLYFVKDFGSARAADAPGAPTGRRQLNSRWSLGLASATA
jgi:hypothetical protein